MQKLPAPPQEPKLSSLVLPASLPRRSLLANLLLAAFSLALVAWSVRLLQTRYTSITSLDAVINGTVIDVKAPQAGTVATLKTTTGAPTTRNRVLLTLQNDQISKSAMQAAKTRLNQQQAQLAQAQVQLNQQLALMQQVAADQQNQSQLETLEAQDAIGQARADLEGARARLQLAQLQYQRMSTLRSQGAVPQANLDTAALEMQQRQAEVTSLTTRIKTAQTVQRAASLGLTLSRTRSNYDPRIRLQELQQQITNQQQYIATLKQSIQDARAELSQATADWQRQRQRIVITPVSGVTWRLTTQPGKHVEQGDSLVQLLDCNRRWVDVFVDEKGLQSLVPGTPAEITLYGEGAATLRGQVSMVRSGVGRLAAGEDVAVALNQNLPRTTQVRVDLEPQADRGNPKQFCYVGYTARVTFNVK